MSSKSRSSIYLVSLVFVVGFLWYGRIVGAQDITDPTEVVALRAIKNSLVDRNRNLSNWALGDPCSSNWTGVLCYDSVLVDGYLHVVELQLLNLNLSGTLSPELGRLTYMKRMNFMWNNISGSLPVEIGNITALELLLVNGNQLTGSLPESMGYLQLLRRIQIDQNQISGPIPLSFANLTKVKHFHMNNNSISGQLPPELSKLPELVHVLLDNNNLTGYLPPEFSQMPSLLILQLDYNNFEGTTIPESYANMTKLLKLSLRSCNLQGNLPNLSRIPQLGYLDLSSNQLNGSLPTDRFSLNITTINLSNNRFEGTIPTTFSGLPRLQKLILANNSLSGSVPSLIWQNRTFKANETLLMDFRNNMLSNISGDQNYAPNVTIWLEGNPLCSASNFLKFCGPSSPVEDHIENYLNFTECKQQSCPYPYEYAPATDCYCAAPLLIGYRLKSPGFSTFPPYRDNFQEYLSSGLTLKSNQLLLDSIRWEQGPRLRMQLKFFPIYNALSTTPNLFNTSELLRIIRNFTAWAIPDSDIFGPYELLNITLLSPYQGVVIFPPATPPGLSKGALAGIIIGAIAGAVMLSALVSLLIVRFYRKNLPAVFRKREFSRIHMKIDGVKAFTFQEMALATHNFDESTLVGQGGYGKVYRGVLSNGNVVAIKRAEEGSLQGEKEFLTEIHLLSRLHHRNLVSLVGYCDEESEQMLVYEFMPKGTLRDHLSIISEEPLNFETRITIALGAAKGLMYLHTEADPPVIHRDVKASNILLDDKFNAKVADFGLSRLAPVADLEGNVPGHVSTVVKGTLGYLDPEYFLTNKLTDKSDVYSFGIVLLELLTGMQPISHGKNIVREVNSAYQSGMVLTVVDQRMGSYPSECLDKFIDFALSCCQDNPDHRPSMTDVVRHLENVRHQIPVTDRTIPKSNREGTSGKDVTHLSSSSSSNSHPYASMDVSGSNLVSGVMPAIVPR
uniref:non-specific serine/threonine protein kinase n=1 Tax=Sedum alfredii TaxID=439688 RepID=A0A410N687_9MAGN|nr:LRR receptor-like serine/threonine-protein kinase [Sedum alfredii]